MDKELGQSPPDSEWDSMRPRQQIIELFSTFLQFEAEYATSWITDARLRREMQARLQASDIGAGAGTTSEKFWTLHWYRQWQTERQTEQQTEPQAEQQSKRQTEPRAVSQAAQRAYLHLAAYLQEPCYWSAQQTARKFTHLQYRLPDCFQLAIAETAAVLRGFSPDRGASLKTYANMAFSSLMRDALRQRQVVDLCTDWALLRRISKKRLLEALAQAGVAASLVPQYRLAWVCFQTLYVPKAAGEKLPKPDVAFWQAVAQLYNQEQVGSTDAATLEKRLTQIAQWVRAYLYPAVGSLNTPKFAEETSEIQDSLADPNADSLLNHLVAEEEQAERTQQQGQLNQTLAAAITRLDAQSQEILRLYYQQGLTQQQIMTDLALSQSSVSRRLSKARETMLKALAQWSQSLNINLTPALIKDMSGALDEWLSAQYQAQNQAQYQAQNQTQYQTGAAS
jgi:RNA polymerase sigma factor (sigma-70 family)